MNLVHVIQSPRSGRQQALILDHFEYSHAVILQERPIPWDDPMAYSNFVGQGQTLLKPDTAILHIDRFYAHKIQQDENLRTSMRAKTRTGYALRTLLSDGEVLDQAWALANAMTQNQSEPVLVQIPSPLRWLLTTHPYSGKNNVQELNADDAENASMFVADWLRNFSGLPLAGILLDDRAAAKDNHPNTVDLDVYTPIINVAENYKWSLGMRQEDNIVLWDVESNGTVIDSSYWTADADAMSDADFFFTEIPATAVPEEVIRRVEAFK